ncbi:hypothetical protein IFM89_038306 [Coptis chinensis]|uniref:Uncharacterized protein n=1 Tax=Coptis chinensis TaxID=261450 RepID=A0A835I8W5_9MAGN|nr:hypothetical protein IFM89_038306 [Coptis chinensis]
MAGSQEKRPNSGDDEQKKRSSRLQKRAPASIQVQPASGFSSEWKVAIPLLSPLILSPASPPPKDHTLDIKLSSAMQESRQDGQIDKPSFKLWQHPAAPFHYEPTPFKQSFVPRCR